MAAPAARCWLLMPTQVHPHAQQLRPSQAQAFLVLPGSTCGVVPGMDEAPLLRWLCANNTAVRLSRCGTLDRGGAGVLRC